jgi:hypothetical protein
MAPELDTMDDKQLAVELEFPEGSERHQKAKAALNYRQLNAQTKATKAQLDAIEVQKFAAVAEAKAAEASIASAKAAERAAVAAERNAKSALFSAGATGVALWSVMHPR